MTNEAARLRHEKILAKGFFLRAPGFSIEEKAISLWHNQSYEVSG